MKKVTKEYLMIDPRDLIRADEHLNTFPLEEGNDQERLMLSYLKYDRLKPVYYFEEDVEGKIINKLIDGDKYVQFSIQEGMQKIFACKLTFEDRDDLIKIMVQLQRSNHESLQALFHMIQALWPIYFKGAGYRSDLTEQELDGPTESADGSKALNIYQRIGLDLCLSGNAVKHIRKVGMVNQLYYERIEIGRFSLYAAYLACLSEERGDEAPVPSVKEPIWVKTTTDAPEFSTPTTTEVATTTPANESAPGDSEQQPVAATEDRQVVVSKAVADNGGNITIRIKCPHCEEDFDFLIPQSLKA